MKKLFIILFFPLLLSGCNNRDSKIDLGKIELELQVERFDTLLFEMNRDTLAEGVVYLYQEYEDFLDIFSYYIINIGHPGSRDYAAGLTRFLNDPLNREVYRKTKEEFSDLTRLNNTFRDAFKRYLYYFPDDSIPRCVSFVSRFNNPGFTVSNYLGIGLDMYLGAESEYYLRMALPQYMRRNMIPEKIPSDMLKIWAGSKFPYNDSVDNVLSHIIHEGKMLFLVSKLLPDQPDSLLIGYSPEEMKWCRNNEEQMWVDLVEKKIIFSQDAMDIRKLTGPAPFTPLFTSESPGRAGAWIGWQIVKEYAERNSQLSLADIMNNNNYQKILEASRYNPD